MASQAHTLIPSITFTTSSCPPCIACALGAAGQGQGAWPRTSTADYHANARAEAAERAVRLLSGEGRGHFRAIRRGQVLAFGGGVLGCLLEMGGTGKGALDLSPLGRYHGFTGYRT